MNVKKILFSVGQMVVIIALTVCFFRYVVIPVRISGSSMENTLHDHDIAFVSALGVTSENIDRFDVVIAYSDQLQETIIKRVIGLPGETIQYKDDVLYIDGEKVEENFLDQDFIEESKINKGVSYFTEDFTYSLGDDEYFLMGDNRLGSTDSRDLGAFHIEDIKGVDGLVFYPFSHIKWLDE